MLISLDASSPHQACGLDLPGRLWSSFAARDGWVEAPGTVLPPTDFLAVAVDVVVAGVLLPTDFLPVDAVPKDLVLVVPPCLSLPFLALSILGFGSSSLWMCG